MNDTEDPTEDEIRAAIERDGFALIRANDDGMPVLIDLTGVQVYGTLPAGSLDVNVLCSDKAPTLFPGSIPMYCDLPLNHTDTWHEAQQYFNHNETFPMRWRRLP